MAKAYTTGGGSRFFMLGVIHGDGEGKRLLSDWLESAAPDAITVELSRYGLRYRQSKGEALKEKVRAAVGELRAEGLAIDNDALGRLFSYIDLPFEFTSPRDYAAKHGVPLFPIDLDEHSSLRLSRMEELIAKKNLALFLSPQGRSAIGSQRAMARLYFEKGINAFPYTEEMRLRDRHMSGTIAQLLKLNTPARLVHICGWQHLCDPFDEYGPLHPRKVFIHDKAFCV
jgi:hypothetical protein